MYIILQLIKEAIWSRLYLSVFKNERLERKNNMIKNKRIISIFCLLISLLMIISISAAECVYAGGMPFGVRFDAGEVTVINTSQFSSQGKLISPAKEAGIAQNDIIKYINGKRISSTTDVVNALKSATEDNINLVIKRGEKEINVSLSPKVCDDTGEKQLGVMLKDSSAGIGTVTFVKEDTLAFAGLGHGICDSTSGEILKIENGYISNVTISGISKGKCGTPGELKGTIDSEKCGKLISNTEVGIYGVFTNPPELLNKKVEIASMDEVKTGAATILCTLDNNTREEFDIKISEINHDTLSKTKNYIIKVTDKDLLSKTGGIVQGMSGSPIIQNGKLIGAVTHVMINDPTTGYGIYIGNMINEMKKAA